MWLALALLALIGLPVQAESLAAGRDRYQTGDLTGAIRAWQTALDTETNPEQQRQLHEHLGLSLHQAGRLDAAVEAWQAALALDDTLAARTALAEVYLDLGQPVRAIATLTNQAAFTQISTEVVTLPDAAAMGVLGNAYLSLANPDAAITAYSEAVRLARLDSDPALRASVLNNLGNAHSNRAAQAQFEAEIASLEGDLTVEAERRAAATADLEQAQAAFAEAIATGQANPLLQAQILLNLNRSLQQTATPDPQVIERHQQLATELLQPLTDSSDRVYTLINLALGLSDQAAQLELLQAALASADRLGDQRARSFAQGSMGRMYEQLGNDDLALQWTRQAQLSAQNAPDSLYRWQWQAARLLNQQGDRQGAIVTYRQAIATLQQIRGGILAASRNLQFDFRDGIEPIYRELLSLLLTDDTSLDEALAVLDLLSLAELQEFYGDDCVEVAQALAQASQQYVATYIHRKGQYQLAQQAAPAPRDGTTIVYSVILADQVYLITENSQGQRQRFTVPVSGRELEDQATALRLQLENRATNAYRSLASQLYDSLMRPLEASLDGSDTLVFVHDGALRQIPMAALYDGQHFLIERFAIAITPSLSLTSRASEQRSLEGLFLGLSLEVEPFAALTNVPQEAEAVQSVLGGPAILDEDFTVAALSEQLRSADYPILHLATHGKFGVNTESTFLLAYDANLTLEQLDQLLRQRPSDQPLELLILSACQTAAGDNRSTLGMAGAAVRAGVRSVLATLWYVNDESTVYLMDAFYHQLQDPAISKAEALRRAQIELIRNPDFAEFSHPAIWAPFTLIGNWS